MKYKPKLTVKTTNFTEGNELLEKSPTTAKPTYTEMLKTPKNQSIRTSKTNLNNYRNNKNMHEKLRSLSPTFRTRKQGNIPSKNNSNTDDKCQHEINELKEEIKLLKQYKKRQHDPKTEMYRNNRNSESKNENTAYVSYLGQQGHRNQLHRTNHENFVKLRRAIENTTGLQSEPARQVINLSTKKIQKRNFQTIQQKLKLCSNLNKFQ